MPLTVADIATHIGGTLQGDDSVELTGFAGAEQAKAGDLTFAENAAYFEAAVASPAAAIIVDGDFQTDAKPLIRVPNARLGCARAVALFFPEPSFEVGIHPSAVVAPSARVASSAHIGPHCTIGANVEIGPHTVIQAGCFVGQDSRLGEGVHLFPNVTIYHGTHLGNRVRIHSGTVIGSDGFGYVIDQGTHFKIPQVGHVIIGDDVEIGSNVTVDRGAFGPTVIGRGTKIDNLIQLGHNVRIGEHCLLVSQVGIAGSTEIGNYVTIAGQVGVAGHLQIGNKVVIAAQSGVMHDIPDGTSMLGTPAREMREMKKIYLAEQRLPELMKRVRALEKSAEAAEGSPS